MEDLKYFSLLCQNYGQCCHRHHHHHHQSDLQQMFSQVNINFLKWSTIVGA